MMFCLDDGAELLYGPASSEARLIDTDEPATAILSEPGAIATGFRRDDESGESKTAILSHTGAEAEPQKNLGDTSERHSPSANRAAKPQSQRNKLLAICGITVLLLVGGFLGYRYFKPVDTEQINSIAVLPFENRSGSADTDYLSDGLADSLIYRLSQLPNLKVSPTSSVMRYKGSATDVAQIAKELEVDAVMSGRLVQRGDDLSISVQLINSRTRKLIWAEQYDRKMSDLLATQREIATTITQKLQLKLSGEEKAITKRYTTSNEAYQLYLKGRFYWNRRTGESIAKAIDLLKSATEKDPNFALAYAALADCYVVTPVYSGQRSNEALLLAKSYAQKAIDLDPTLAEPHSALAMAIWFNDWDKEAAEKEYLRALELNPNYPTGHHWYSRLLRSLKRSDEAYREINRAVELDPLSLIFINNVAEQQIERGDLEGAAETCRRIIELEPSFWAVHQTLVWLYVKQGNLPEALASAQKAVELSGRSNPSLGQLGHVMGLLGRKAEAQAVVKELEDRYAKRSADARDVAVVYTGIGDKDAAFAWLEKAYEYRSFNMANLNMEFLLTPLHDDLRWADLKRRVGIP